MEKQVRSNETKIVNRRFLKPRTLTLMVLFLALIMGGVSTVSAADGDMIYVNGTGGSDDNNGISWQYAKQSIKNATGTVNSNGTVHIANGTYKGSNNRGITINKSMNIIGQSQSGTIIDAEGSGRIFTINRGVNVTIQSLTLTNGTVSNGGAISNNDGSLTVSHCTFTGNTATNGYGGAIYNDGNLDVSESTFTGNTANTSGGAISNYYDYDGTLNVNDSTFTNNTATSGYGGAILNGGSYSTLNVNGSTFTGNTATMGGAIYNTGSYSTLNVNGSTFTGNTVTGTYGYGGAIHKTGSPSTLNVSDSTFTDNTANSRGGAIYILGNCNLTVSGSTFTGNTVTSGYGGAIYILGNCNLTVSGSTFTGNTVTSGYGGAIYNTGTNSTLTVNGSTFTENKATGDESWGGAIYNTGTNSTLTVNGSTFQGNTVKLYGGAIFNHKGTLNVNGSNFTENKATGEESLGGAIINYEGTVTVSDSTFTGNTAKTHGGAIASDDDFTVSGSTFTDNSAKYGGAIANENSLTVSGSTFTNNTATWNGGAIENLLTLNVSECTFTGNSATYDAGAIYNEGNSTVSSSSFTNNHAGDEGGAIYNNKGSVNVEDSTFNDNTADYIGGAIYLNNGSVTVNDSIFTGNTAKLGGAILNNGGTLNVKDSAFTGNSATTIGGGAIHNTGYNNVNVNGSTFTGNKATGSTGSGGAIYNTSNTSDGAFNVDGSTFTGNTATSSGGAIYNRRAGTFKVQFSRITGNTANEGQDIYFDPQSYVGKGSVNATCNWWGSNNGPSSGRVSENVTVGPWLVLTVKPNPTLVSVNGKSTITADLLHDSNGGYHDPADGHVPDGISVQFSATLGAIPSVVTTSNGKAEATFTAGDTKGLSTIRATIDNETQTTRVNIGKDDLYVSPTGNDETGNGSSQYPFQTIGKAVAEVSSNGIVHLLNGTYTGPKNTGITINRSMNIVGQSQSGTIIDAKDLSRIFLINPGVNVTINKLTLANGYHASYGGAIYVYNGSTLNVGGSTFKNNTASRGGAIYVYKDGTLNVSSSTFTGNIADNTGGAIYVYKDGTLNVNSSTFTGNKATRSGGGAIYNDDGTANVNDSTFTGNTAGFTGSTTTDGGGAIYNYYGTLNVSNSTFTNNTAIGDNTATGSVTGEESSGGAIYNQGSGSHLNVSSSTFTGNTATSSGGAISNTSADTLNIDDSTFTENAANRGGAIYSHRTDALNIVSSTFTGNTATSRGGAIFSRVFNGSEIHFSRIVGNTANEGQDIYFEPLHSDGRGSVNASYNWWGSNSGPSSGHVSNGVTVGPWLVLTVTAHPAIIPANGKSTITADLLHDSNGGYHAYGHVPDGIPVTFTVTNGTINPESSTLSGSATSTFTATTGGPVKFAATVDNQTVSTTSTAMDSVSNFAGQNVNLTANVTDVNGDPANEGQVQFIVNNKEIGTSTVSNGKATFNWKIPDGWSVGNYNVVVNYWGTVNYHVSSGTGTLTVTRTPTNITVNTANGHAGHDVNLTANVTDINGNPANEGQVHFTVNGRTVGSAPVDENGIATFNGWSIPSTWSVKQYAIVAKYLGTANFSVSESTGNLTVDHISTSLTVDPASGSKGNSINLTAKLWDNLYNKPVDGKQVDFYVNDVKKGSGTTDKNGVATYKYTLTQNVGNYTIKAVFTEDTQYANADGINTLSIIDKTAPTIVSVNPTNGATKVAANKTIKVTFSEEIKTGSLWIELKNSTGKAIPFNHTISGKVLTIKPISNLPESLYTLIIHTGAVTDLAGNPVALKSTKFSVGDSPKIISTNPKNSATNVDASKTIEVTFNENIKKGNNWIELKNSDGKSVSFTTSISGKVLTIKPKNKLAESKYKLILHTGAVTDQAGNPLALKSFTFTTGTPPTITKTDPKNNAVNIARNKTIKVTFNENIKAGSNYWIELVDKNGSKIAIKKSIKGKVLTITPTAKLKANTKYKLILHTGSLTDTAGNPLALKTISFTTKT